MKQLRSYINVRKGKSTVIATNDTIHKIVRVELDKLGHVADLNHIDVSGVTMMDDLFNCAQFTNKLGASYSDLNPDISKWDVSNVTNMYSMFKFCSKFNCDISGWDVSNVENMNSMFYGCHTFNQDLSGWNVSKVENMYQMFYGCENFNQDIGKWNVKKLKAARDMFFKCKSFDQDLSSWNAQNVTIYLVDFAFGCPIADKPEFLPKMNFMKFK